MDERRLTELINDLEAALLQIDKFRTPRLERRTYQRLHDLRQLLDAIVADLDGEKRTARPLTAWELD